jgi:biopolymer transport protein ExbB/TolQ
LFSDLIKEMLRAIASSMQIPTIVVLLFLLAIAVIALGSLFAEWFTEHRRMKEKIPEVIDRFHMASLEELDRTIEESGLLKRQKAALKALTSRIHLPEHSREALARQLIFDEQSRYDKIVKWTDVITRIAPMFGLLGTLIPLGPGLIALGQGDTKTLSASLLIAFDTTIAGLISAAIAFVISSVRKRWYDGYLVGMETLMEAILEKQTVALNAENSQMNDKKGGGDYEKS